MPDPPPKRPWWKRKRTWTALTLWLAVAYPLSVGPALYGRFAGWLPPSVLKFYRPVSAVGGDSTVGRAWDAYINWWTERGVETGEANGTFHLNRSNST